MRKNSASPSPSVSTPGVTAVVVVPPGADAGRNRGRQDALCGICGQTGHGIDQCPYLLQRLAARTPHQCEFAWCTTDWDYEDQPQDHYQGMTYVVPTTYPDRVASIGACLTFDEGEQGEPWITVHLDGSEMDESLPDVDADTHLTIEEAIELRDLLDVAISHGLGYEMGQQ